MGTLLELNSNPQGLSPKTLAFIGDSVYDILVREYLVNQANRPVGQLNRMKVRLVKCEAQAKSAAELMPLLTEEETAVFRRGRNAFTRNTPKNSDTADYHAATGLEALFGYLYLNNERNRIRELFNIIIHNSISE